MINGGKAWNVKPSLNSKKVFKNLNNKTLKTEDEEVLALRLNFAIAPKCIPVAEIIAAIEATFQ